MGEQQDRIDEFIDAHDEYGIIIMDAGRADYFEELAPDYLEGEFEAVHNGGHGYTATWFADSLDGEYDAQFYHGGQPIWSFNLTDEHGESVYDEREHFADVPAHTEYSWDPTLNICLPQEVNRVIGEHYTGGSLVVRYLCPHPPFPDPDVNEVTRTKARIRRTQQALQASEVSKQDLWDAYENYYAEGIREVTVLLDSLELGNVVITADHGELLGENGRWYHGPNYPDIEALTTVPWFEVGE